MHAFSFSFLMLSGLLFWADKYGMDFIFNLMEKIISILSFGRELIVESNTIKLFAIAISTRKFGS